MRYFKLALLLLVLSGLLGATTSHAAIQYYDDRATFIGDVNVTTNIDFEGILGPGQTTKPYSNTSGLTIDGVNFTGHANLSATNDGSTPFMTGFYLRVTSNNAAAPQMDYEFASGDMLEWFYGDSFPSFVDTDVTITLPANTKVFGTDLMFKRFWSEKSNGATNPDNIGTHMTVILSDGSLYTVNMEPSDDNEFGVGIPNRSFFGFVSDTPIASLTIHGGTILANQINGGYSTYMPQFFFVDGGHPLLDNVILGTPVTATVPEPTSMLLFGMCMAGLGCYTRRRREV